MGNMKLGRAMLRPMMRKVAGGFDLEKFGGKITKNGFKRAGQELKTIGSGKLRSEWASLKVQVRPLRQPRTNRQIPVLFLGSDELDFKESEKEMYATWQITPSEYDQLKQNRRDRKKSYWRVGMKGAGHVGIMTDLDHAQKAVKFYRQWRRVLPKTH